MSNILILGGNGRQGVALQKHLTDHDVKWVDRGDDINEAIHSRKWDLVFSCLPYNLNLEFGDETIRAKMRWADLGGHIQTSKYLHDVARSLQVTIATDLGLAPGLLEYLAWRRMQVESKIPRSITLYCGGLPCGPIDAFGYALTFSSRGLANEYVNDCHVLWDGKICDVLPMWAPEIFSFGDLRLEAAHTSGALSKNSLLEFNAAGVQNCRYRTLRYRGHWGLVKNAWDNCQDFEAFTEWLEIIAQPGDVPDTVFFAVAFDGSAGDWRGQIPCSGMTAMQLGTSAPAAAVAELLVAGTFDGIDIVKPGHIGKSDLFWERFGKNLDLNAPV